MTSAAILSFLLGSLFAGVALITPPLVIALRSSRLGAWKWVWVLASLLAAILPWVLKSRINLAQSVVLSWLFYVTYLWFNRDRNSLGRLTQAVRLGVCALVLVVIAVKLGGGSSASDIATINWPLDRVQSRFLQLTFPTAFRPSISSNSPVADPPDQDPTLDATGRPVHYWKARDMRLDALWPNFVPQTEKNAQEFTVPGGGRMLAALISSGAVDEKNPEHDSLKAVFKVAIESLKFFCTGTDVPQKATCLHISAPFEQPSIFGLKAYAIDSSAYPFTQDDLLKHDDILISTDDAGVPLTVIRCTPNVPYSNGIRIYPKCQQYFVDSRLNALIQLDYSRDLLRNWRELQSGWSAFLGASIVVKGAAPVAPVAAVH